MEDQACSSIRAPFSPVLNNLVALGIVTKISKSHQLIPDMAWCEHDLAHSLAFLRSCSALKSRDFPLQRVWGAAPLNRREPAPALPAVLPPPSSVLPPPPDALPPPPDALPPPLTQSGSRPGDYGQMQWQADRIGGLPGIDQQKRSVLPVLLVGPGQAVDS